MADELCDFTALIEIIKNELEFLNNGDVHIIRLVMYSPHTLRYLNKDDNWYRSVYITQDPQTPILQAELWCNQPEYEHRRMCRYTLRHDVTNPDFKIHSFVNTIYDWLIYANSNKYDS